MPEGHGTKKNILEFGNSKCKGPETRVHSVWLETSRKTKYGHNEQGAGEKGVGNGARITWAPGNHCEDRGSVSGWGTRF